MLDKQWICKRHRICARLSLENFENIFGDEALRRKPTYFKILRQDLISLGLAGVMPIQYYFNIWNKPKERTSKNPNKGGGLWIVKGLGNAKKLKRYVKEKHGIEARIFSCQIRGVLFESSYRVKTRGVYFGENSEIIC